MSTLFKSIGAVTLISAAGHLFGFGREVAVAYYFGASSVADGILVGLIPITIYASVFGTAYANAAIVKIGSPPDEVIAAETFAPLLVLGAVSGLVFLFFAEHLVRLMAPGLSGEGRDLAIAFVQLSSIGAACVSISFWGRSLLHVEQRFERAAVSDILPNVGAILGVVILYRIYGIYGLALGGILGYIAQFFLVTPWRYAKLAAVRFSVLIGSNLRGVYANTLMAALSYSTVYVDVIVDRYFASQLAEGSITVMNFAQKLMLLPLYTVVIALSTVIFPKLIAAKDSSSEFSKIRRQAYHLTLLAVAPITVFSLVFSQELVALAFNYGRFDKDSVALTGGLFQIYMLGFIAHAFVLVASRVHYARERFFLPLIAGLLSAIVNVALNFLLVNEFGVFGLAAATSVAAAVNSVILIYFGRR